VTAARDRRLAAVRELGTRHGERIAAGDYWDYRNQMADEVTELVYLGSSARWLEIVIEWARNYRYAIDQGDFEHQARMFPVWAIERA